MDKFAENIYNLCEAVIPYAPAVAVVALLLIGVYYDVMLFKVKPEGMDLYLSD